MCEGEEGRVQITLQREYIMSRMLFHASINRSGIKSKGDLWNSLIRFSRGSDILSNRHCQGFSAVFFFFFRVAHFGSSFIMNKTKVPLFPSMDDLREGVLGKPLFRKSFQPEICIKRVFAAAAVRGADGCPSVFTSTRVRPVRVCV